jgi:tRNA dimethylallyltransferase
MIPKKVYIIVGPTAVGKTTFAISLAQHLNAEIISADARQCYQELNIGVARPTKHELSLVPHHFIASHSIHEMVNAAVFESYALAKVNELFKKYDSVVMVGGTGLYIKAFCEGLDAIPTIDPSVRESIQKKYSLLGLEWLQKELAQKDPLFWEQCEQQNPQRLMRALEVLSATGNSILTFQQQNKKNRPFDMVKIGLQMPRDLLYERINQRVEKMVSDGLEDEMKNLFPYKDLNALQTVGYHEWLPYFEKKSSINEVVKNIQQNTRHYAKRQMTWFQKVDQIQWYEALTVSTTQINF